MHLIHPFKNEGAIFKILHYLFCLFSHLLSASQSTRAHLVDKSKRGKVSRKRRRGKRKRQGIWKAVRDPFIAGLMRKSAKCMGSLVIELIKKRVSDLKKGHMQCTLQSYKDISSLILVFLILHGREK